MNSATKHSGATAFELSAIQWLLFGYPILLLSLKKGMDGSFLLMALLSCYVLARARAPGPRIWDQTAVAYALAMASLTVAILLSEWSHGRFVPQPYDGASRFLFAIPIYLMLRATRSDLIAPLEYAFPLGALSGAAVILWFPRDWGDGRLGSYFLNPIHFGDLALILGALSLFSIDWRGRDRMVLRVLKWSGLAAGLYASVVSGSRGGWVALPVIAGLWIQHRWPHRPFWQRLGMLGVVLVIGVTAFLVVPQIHGRIDDIGANLSALSHGDPNTSIGIRLQLWKVAWLLFRAHPLFGVGPHGFQALMAPLSQQGLLTQTAAMFGRGEVHNEIMARAVKLGIFGLVAIVSVYLVPFVLFLRAVRRSACAWQRTAALMGLAFVISFFIFGLTVETFDLTMTAAFYTLTVAVLLALATGRLPGGDALTP